MISVKEVQWINNVRGICILFVYLAHSEAYYGVQWVGSRFYSPFYVNLFYIVSGYLLFKKILQIEKNEDFLLAAKQNLQNVFFRLVIPTIFFTAIFQYPKSIFNKTPISIWMFLVNSFGGGAFWFTSSLVVAQLCLIGMMILFKRKLFLYLPMALALCVISIILKQISPNPLPWFYKAGLMAVIFLVIGGFYYRFETFIDKYKKTTIVISSVIFFGYLMSDYTAICSVMNVNFNLIGCLMVLSSSCLVIYLSKFNWEMRLLTYIGKNSVVFYFFCGFFPALCSTVYRKLEISDVAFCSVGAIFLVSILLAIIFSFVLNKYFPFLLDVRKIFK